MYCATICCLYNTLSLKGNTYFSSTSGVKLERLTKRATAPSQVSNAEMQGRAGGSQLWGRHLSNENSCRGSPRLTQSKTDEQSRKGLLILGSQQTEGYEWRRCNAGSYIQTMSACQSPGSMPSHRPACPIVCTILS